MITEMRRSKRVRDYLPLIVTARDGATGKTLAGPFSGRIIDISRHGACLLMSQVMQQGFHIFHSTREDDSRILQLSMTIPPDQITFTITARPVWLDLFRQDEISAFKMGVEFLVHPQGEQMKRLRQAISIQQPQRGHWWTSHVAQRQG